MTPILEFRNVLCGPILLPFSLAVFAGERVLLQGAGRVLLDLARQRKAPEKGTVLLLGRDIWLWQRAEVAALVGDAGPAPARLLLQEHWPQAHRFWLPPEAALLLTAAHGPCDDWPGKRIDLARYSPQTPSPNPSPNPSHKALASAPPLL